MSSFVTGSVNSNVSSARMPVPISSLRNVKFPLQGSALQENALVGIPQYAAASDQEFNLDLKAAREAVITAPARSVAYLRLKNAVLMSWYSGAEDLEDEIADAETST